MPISLVGTMCPIHPVWGLHSFGFWKATSSNATSARGALSSQLAKAPPGPDFGNLGTWESKNVESKKISKIKVLKIQIHVAQNVGKVWIGWQKNLPGPIWAHPRP